MEIELAQAGEQLDELVDLVLAGELVDFTEAGHRVARPEAITRERDRELVVTTSH